MKEHSRLFSMQAVIACISTTAVLLLVGILLMFMQIADNLSSYIRENLEITVVIDDQATRSDILKIEKFLRGKSYVKHTHFVSKEQALHEQMKAIGDNPADFLGHNPFTSTFEVNLHYDYANTDSLENVVLPDIKNNNKIIDVMYQQELMESMNHNIHRISTILLIMSAVMLCISFILIYNTIRLSIYSKRFLIHTMKLVGASWGFIRRPFIIQSLSIGLIGAIIADALLFAGTFALINYEPDMREVVTDQILYITMGIITAFGILFSLLCYYLSVNKFLDMEADKLYKI
ncbi:MAG: permease-like cell division protein FtsX [Bacteroidaceae bacterium]|nr:permease-like cell division protein FtsX [Bacteroidaceae bacterium]